MFPVTYFPAKGS